MLAKKIEDGAEIQYPFHSDPSLNNESNSIEINIIFFGCHGKGNINHGKIIKKKLKERKIDPDFFLLNGDNFYDSGVENDNSPLFQSCFEIPYAKEFNGKIFFPILGNHDYGDFCIGGLKNLFPFMKNRASPQAQIDYSKKSNSWYMPGVYYSIKHKEGLFEFFCIDSNTIYFDDKQKNWLKNKVFTSNAKWKILVCHQPVITNGHHSSEPDVIALNNFICENFQNTGNPKLKFNLFLSAHEHNNQVLVFSEDSFQFIVGNCSSKNPSSVKMKQNTLFCSSEPKDFSFGLLTLNKDNILCKVLGEKISYDFNYNENKNYRKNVTPIQFKYPDLMKKSDLFKNSEIIDGNIYFTQTNLGTNIKNFEYLHFLKIEIDKAWNNWDKNSRLEWYAKRYVELKKIDSNLDDSRKYIKSFAKIFGELPWLELWKVVENLYVFISDVHFYCLKIMENHEMKKKMSRRQNAINELEESIYNIYNLFYVILNEFYRTKKGNKPVIDGKPAVSMRAIDFHSQAISDLYKFEAYCNRCRLERGYKTVQKLKFKVGHKGKDY